jgi:hypothetical protein
MAVPHTTTDSFLVQPLADTIEAVCILQMGQHNTDLWLRQVEEATKQFGEIQRKMDDKLDSIHRLPSQWNDSEMGRAQRPQCLSSPSPTPPHQINHHNSQPMRCLFLKSKKLLVR